MIEEPTQLIAAIDLSGINHLTYNGRCCAPPTWENQKIDATLIFWHSSG